MYGYQEGAGAGWANTIRGMEIKNNKKGPTFTVRLVHTWYKPGMHDLLRDMSVGGLWSVGTYQVVVLACQGLPGPNKYTGFSVGSSLAAARQMILTVLVYT